MKTAKIIRYSIFSVFTYFKFGRNLFWAVVFFLLFDEFRFCHIQLVTTENIIKQNAMIGYRIYVAKLIFLKKI